MQRKKKERFSRLEKISCTPAGCEKITYLSRKSTPPPPPPHLHISYGASLTRTFFILYGGPKVSRQFQLHSRQFQFDHGNFNFTHGNFNFTHGNFNLTTAISTSLTTISIWSRQFQLHSRQFLFGHGNFNFTHGNFYLVKAISTSI